MDQKPIQRKSLLLLLNPHFAGVRTPFQRHRTEIWGLHGAGKEDQSCARGDRSQLAQMGEAHAAGLPQLAQHSLDV